MYQSHGAGVTRVCRDAAHNLFLCFSSGERGAGTAVGWIMSGVEEREWVLIAMELRPCFRVVGALYLLCKLPSFPLDSPCARLSKSRHDAYYVIPTIYHDTIYPSQYMCTYFVTPLAWTLSL